MQGSSNVSNHSSTPKYQPLQSPRKSTNRNNHTFIVVDLKSGLMGSTKDERLASSPKKVNQFIKKFGSTLSDSQIKELRSMKLVNLNVEKVKNSDLPVLLKNILIKMEKALAALDNFLTIGKSSKELVKESRQVVHEKAYEKQKQSIANYTETKERALKKLKEYRAETTKLNSLKRIKVPKEQHSDLSHNLQETKRKQNRLKRELGHYIFPEKGDTVEELLIKKYLVNEAEFKKPDMVIFQLSSPQKKTRIIKHALKLTVNLPKLKTGEVERFPAATNFNDRAESRKVYKPRGYYKRAEGDASIRKTVEEHYAKEQKLAPDNKTLGSSAEFKRLGSAKVSFEQIESATKNKISELASNNVDEKRRMVTSALAIKEGAKVISGTLNDILQTLPNDQITTFDELKSALKKQVIANNVKEFKVDRETFENRAKLSLDILNRMSLGKDVFTKLEDMVKNNTWPEGHEETVTYMEIPAENVKEFDSVIDLFFQDADVRRVLNQFF